MHFFKAFTFTVIVVWCRVDDSRSEPENKTTDQHDSVQNRSSPLTELEKSTPLSTTTTTKKSINDTLSTGRTSELEQNSSETTHKKREETRIIIESDKPDVKGSNRKRKVYTRTTSELNATELVPAIRRNARNRTIRNRYGNGTIIRQRLKHRNGRVLYLRKKGNGTRVRAYRKLSRGRGDNGTLQLRSQHRKLRKHNSPSTKNPLRNGPVSSDTESLKNTALSQADHKKQRKHHGLSNTKASKDESALSNTEHMNLEKHHAISTKKTVRDTSATSDTERKKNATLYVIEHREQQKPHISSTNKLLPVGSALSAIGHIKDIALSATEHKKDTTLSDIEHMNQRKHHSASTEKILRAVSDLSDNENKKDVSSENEHLYLQSTENTLRSGSASSTTKRKKHTVSPDNKRTKLRKHPVTTTEKFLRDGSDFSDTESQDIVKKQSHRWPKRKGKKVERQGDKHGSYHAHNDKATGKKRKPNKYNYDTGTTKHRKTTKADLGNELKPYTLKAHMNALKCKFQNANITVEVIGRTMSYYDIVMLKVSEKKRYDADDDDVYFRANENKYADDGPEKRIVFIVHGLSVMGIHGLPCLLEVKPLKKLMSYYFAHLDKFDIFLIPMANPDGVMAKSSTYKSYSAYSEMDWNKNTSPQSECSGVALDRNFDVAWDHKRNLSSCNQQYPGPHPFSESETRAIRDVLHRYSQRIVAYLNVHAGTYSSKIFKGDAVLYPKGYTEVQSDDDRYLDLRGEIEEALKNASFQVYTVNVDSLYSWYGKVSGTSVDYAASVYGIPYSMELVMQLYENSPMSNEEDEEQNAVLSTSWRRVIDVIFSSMQRHLNATGY